MAARRLLDPETEAAARIFLERAAALFPIKGSVVFGRRARGPIALTAMQTSPSS
jgi:hypothetical protein